MIAGLYIRVSTEEQAREGFSIEAQKTKLSAFCQLHDIDIYSFYVDDGISGKSLARPEVQKLISNIRMKNIDSVVVLKLDRLTRSVKDLMQMMDLFEKYKIKFISLSEQIDTSTATGRMFVQLLGVMAEWERGVIGERVTLGMEQKAREGYYSTRHCYGYNYDKVNKVFTQNPEEAEIVKLIFDMYKEGNGYTYIAKYLNDNHIYHGKNPFSIKVITKMIQNGWYYCGKFLYNAKGKEPQLFEAVNILEPILTEEEFLICHNRAESNRENRIVSSKKTLSIFKGRVFCQCGRKLISATSGKVIKNSKYKNDYYFCKAGRDNRCEYKTSISNAKLENLFVEYLDKLSSEEIIVDVSRNEENEKVLQKEINRLEREYEKELQRKQRLTIELLDNNIDNEIYQLTLDSINKKMDSVKNRIRDLDYEIKEINESSIQEENKQVAITLSNAWTMLTKEQKQLFVQTFIEKMVVSKDAIISISFFE